MLVALVKEPSAMLFSLTWMVKVWSAAILSLFLGKRTTVETIRSVEGILPMAVKLLVGVLMSQGSPRTDAVAGTSLDL